MRDFDMVFATPAISQSTLPASNQPTPVELNEFYAQFWKLEEPARRKFVVEWKEALQKRAPKQDFSKVYGGRGY